MSNIYVRACVYKDKAGQKNEKYIFLKQRAFVDKKFFLPSTLKKFFLSKNNTDNAHTSAQRAKFSQTKYTHVISIQMWGRESSWQEDLQGQAAE